MATEVVSVQHLLTKDAEFSTVAIGEEMIDCCLQVDSVLGPLEEEKAFFFSTRCVTKDGSYIIVKSFGPSSNILSKSAHKGSVVQLQNLKAVKNNPFGGVTSKSPFKFELLFEHENSTIIVVKEGQTPQEVKTFDECKNGIKYALRCWLFGPPRLIYRRMRKMGTSEPEYELIKFLGMKILDINNGRAELYVRNADLEAIMEQMSGKSEMDICATPRLYGDILKFEVESIADIKFIR